MEMIKVKKVTVLEVLNKNLAQHEKDYEEALLGWIEKCKVALHNILDELNSDKARETVIDVRLPKPVSYAKEYQKAIKMVEYEVRDEVEISSHDFDKFFLDEWDWKNSFLSNTAMYNRK
ncbi:MAG: hypothetical protein PHF86_06505 [Candidatus Nanoarchaeia archaeon]|jgi:hypothetical protein|nr:hypothetical protein [Candidatus Nanoarchaeia archaeon]